MYAPGRSFHNDRKPPGTDVFEWVAGTEVQRGRLTLSIGPTVRVW